MKTIIVSLLGLGVVGLGVVGLANAGESVATAKTTATMQATCSIEVNPLGFGVVATPLMSQSAQSEMSVKCSNASAYTIELSYGGIYGAGTYSEYSVEFNGSSPDRNIYLIYNNDGAYQGTLLCGHGGTIVEKVWFQNSLISNLYGYTNSDSWQVDTKGACITNNTASGTYPKGWTGAYNASGYQPVGGGTVGYSYGVMQGSFKGDKLAYSISVPGDSTKVWNSGNNSYKSTGNGDFQIIPVVAKIVPDKSGSKHPAPDMYLDTITAVISY